MLSIGFMNFCDLQLKPIKGGVGFFKCFSVNVLKRYLGMKAGDCYKKKFIGCTEKCIV